MEEQEQRNKSPQSELAGDGANARRLSRRRFAKAGVGGGAGVLLSLASRSSLGCAVCKSPSGFLSGNVSQHGPAVTCEGASPGYWKNHTGWPSGFSHSTLFSHVFPVNHGSHYENVTMYNLLSHQSFDVDNIGMHLVAAILNSAKGWTPFLPESTIISMFTEWQNIGYYSPTPHVKWYAADIVNYITSTQS